MSLKWSLNPRALETQGMTTPTPTPAWGRFLTAEGLWEKGQRAPAPPPPGSQLEPQVLSRGQGSSGGPCLKGQSCLPGPGPPQAGSRRMAAPGTQCPWQSGRPPHHKGPFVPTPLALKSQVTRPCWAQGPDCGLSSLPPASAWLFFVEGLPRPVQIHQSNLCLPEEQGETHSPLTSMEHTN